MLLSMPKVFHDEAGPKVPVHVTLGFKRGSSGVGRGAKIDNKVICFRCWPSERISDVIKVLIPVAGYPVTGTIPPIHLI